LFTSLFFTDPTPPHTYTLSLHDALPISFAEASIPQLLSPSQLRQAVHYEADTFASVYLQNNGNGTFSSFALPTLAQIDTRKRVGDRKSTRLNSSHLVISYAVFCLKKKKK